MKRIWKNKIIYLVILFLAIVSFSGILSVKVQAATISGGGADIDSATAISAGKYTVGALAEKENHFYSISVKAGQELVVAGTFRVVTENETYGTNDTIEIYNDTKDSLVSEFDTAPALITVTALADSSKSTHTYYIRISDDTWGTESGELEITLNDRYDANSGTDAGESYDTALATTAGTITGYLSQVDTNDYYSISGVSGNVSAKITPAKEAMPEVKIFDANRKELASEVASNGGEIVTTSADIDTNQKVYIAVNCDINMGCSSEASQYSLVISNGASTGIGDGDGGGTVVPPDVIVDYGTVVPVVPTGGAAQIDAVVRQPLNKTFNDKVKAKEATTDRIVYVVEREIKGNDLQAIKAAMEAQGYKTKSISDTSLVMRKMFKEVKFEIVSGSNQITVSQKYIVSPLWIGIIAGALVLIIIIVVVIVVVSKKKPGVTPPKPAAGAIATAPPISATPPTPPSTPPTQPTTDKTIEANK